jgi:hypothetical protein
MAFSGERSESGRPKENVAAARKVADATTEAIMNGTELPIQDVPQYLRKDYLRNVEIDRVLFANFGKPMFDSRKRYNWVTGYPADKI